MALISAQSIGLGELSVVLKSDDVLTARGLGSCVGITAYDPTKQIAALAHVMLPGPMQTNPGPDQPARFAAQAVEAIIRAFERQGSRRRDMVIKLAGGAQVIKLAGKDDRLQVGIRNISAVREAITKHGLHIAAEDTGGTSGRTLCLYAATGQVTVRVVGGKEQTL